MKVMQVKAQKKEGAAAGFRTIRPKRQSSSAAFNPIALLSRSTEREYPQAKLKIGSPGDIYEQQADQTAEQVMNMPEPAAQRQPVEEEEPIQARPLAEQITPLVQRQPEEEEEPVQEQTSKPEPKRKACVESESIPKEHWGVQARQMAVYDYFTMSIDWKKRSKQNPTCDCSCGEYRQYVKGYIKVNGERKKKQLCGNTFLNDEYQEDGEKGIPYGHRDLQGGSNDKFVDPASPDTLVDRKTACGYRGSDTPGLDIVPSGSRVDMHLMFKGQTYDRRNKTHGEEHKWETKWKGEVP